jgi:hypothetical protein
MAASQRDIEVLGIRDAVSFINEKLDSFKDADGKIPDEKRGEYWKYLNVLHQLCLLESYEKVRSTYYRKGGR